MRKLGLEIFSFGIAGVLGYLVDVAVLYLLLDALGLYLGRVFSFLSAATATWLFNRSFTFRRRPSGIPLGAEYRTYLFFMVAGGTVNFAAYIAVLQTVPTAPPFIAVAIGSVSGMAVNFFLSRRLLFRNNP